MHVKKETLATLLNWDLIELDIKVLDVRSSSVIIVMPIQWVLV